MKISTTKGEMDDSLLQRLTGGENNKHESTRWVEFWLGGNLDCPHMTNGNGGPECACGAEMVKRSARVHIKEPATFSESGIAEFK